MQRSPALVVIGGTTASGKSALALGLARATGGVVVNADSMQLYRDLRILTARPSATDEALAEHRLYGVLDASETSSAGLWLELVAPVLREVLGQARPAIVVGGTGLYLHALLHGLSPMPPVPDEVRRRVRGDAAGVPAPELHRRLAAVDPAMALRLRPSDPQRILRAMEVLAATGRSLADWQALPPERIPGLPEPVGIAIVPPAAQVAAAVGRRLERMVEEGALDELARLDARRDVPADAPILRATGFPELRQHLHGHCTLAEALERATFATRRYAKRQRTFLRHRLAGLAVFRDAADPALRALLAVRIGVGPTG
ncbi:MAG: tRNA (adenosine(37)-N6)-dimethylallyltransferase MiaA [Geminicoccaceae bacterium]